MIVCEWQPRDQMGEAFFLHPQKKKMCSLGGLCLPFFQGSLCHCLRPLLLYFFSSSLKGMTIHPFLSTNKSHVFHVCCDKSLFVTKVKGGDLASLKLGLANMVIENSRLGTENADLRRQVAGCDQRAAENLSGILKWLNGTKDRREGPQGVI